MRVHEWLASHSPAVNSFGEQLHWTPGCAKNRNAGAVIWDERTYKDVAHQYQQSTPPFGPLSPSPLKTLVPWVPHAHVIHMQLRVASIAPATELAAYLLYGDLIS